MKGTTTLIAVDGTETAVEWSHAIPLKFLQEAVGGYIELVPYFNEFRGAFCVAWCNEHGKISTPPMEVNKKANEHWAIALNGAAMFDTLRGPILIVQGDNEFIEAL